MRSAIIAALIALAAGCGFAPSDDFTGRRAGDGIAPWQDLGPVYLCIGNEFIGPPDSEAGGLCSSQSVVEAQCVADDDCRSRETCVCGRCTIQYCTALSDCRGARTCSFSEARCDTPCGADDECADGEECFNSTCRGRCFTNDDCQTGEVCNSQNRCATARCSDDGDCLADEICRVQRVPRVATEPTLLARKTSGEPRFAMWLEMSEELQQDRRAIWRATSLDGQNFTIDPARPVIEDGLAAHAPSVVRTATGLALYYEQGDGAELRVVESTNGIDWGSPTTVLSGGTGPNAVRAPSAVVVPDQSVLVYYQLGDGDGIALATGQLGAALVTLGPVLTAADVVDPPTAAPDSQFWIEISAVRSPFVALTTGAAGAPSLRMWFSAFGRESGDSLQFGEVIPIDPNYSIGYAATTLEAPDRLEMWPFNPVIDNVAAFLDHRTELSPAIVQVTSDSGVPRDGYLLYYLDAVTDAPLGPFVLNRLRVAGNGTF